MSASFDKDTLKVDGLKQLLKALKAPPPTARVGILSGKGQRKGKGPSNAEIGAAHEFGTVSIPQRSFLRMPITEGLTKEMESRNLLGPARFKEVIKSGTVIPWMEEVVGAALACVADAFATHGNGKWVSWKNPKYENNTGDLLVDTQQLRESITGEVK